jgi:hypothetical protein
VTPTPTPTATATATASGTDSSQDPTSTPTASPRESHTPWSHRPSPPYRRRAQSQDADPRPR